MPSPDEHLVSTFAKTQTIFVRGAFYSFTNQGNLTSLQRDRWTTSVVTPNFREVNRKRWYLPNNPYHKRIIVLSDPETSWSAEYREPTGYYDEWFWQWNCSVISGEPQNVANADDPSQRAIARMLQTLSSTKVNTLVTAAEMHKTADLIAKTATRLYNAYRDIKRGDFTGFTSSLGLTTSVQQKKRFNKRYNAAKSRDAQEHKYSEGYMMRQSTESNVSRFAGETWLEYSYGWTPLLYDVYGHAQALAELSIKRENVIRHVKGRAKTWSKKTKSSLATGDPHFITRESEDRRWVEYGVAYKLQAGELNTFSQLGIDNPLEVLWEIVPLSFVADWFLPIGGFLKSLTATTGLVFYTGYKSERRFTDNKTTVEHCGTVQRQSGESTYSGVPMVQRHQDLSMTRSGLIDFPTPQLPDFRNPFGSGEDYGLKKAMSAVALLQSLFLKKATR